MCLRELFILAGTESWGIGSSLWGSVGSMKNRWQPAIPPSHFCKEIWHLQSTACCLFPINPWRFYKNKRLNDESFAFDILLQVQDRHCWCNWRRPFLCRQVESPARVSQCRNGACQRILSLQLLCQWWSWEILFNTSHPTLLWNVDLGESGSTETAYGFIILPFLWI